MTSQPSLFQGLNDAQREAVETVDGPLLIVAGPGSGKTRVITHRIAHLVHDYGIPPYRIAAVTFTNKAAREMRDRVARLVGTNANSVTGGTFHAFCGRMLRQYGEMIGVNRNYSIYDSDDQLALIKQAEQMASKDPQRFPPRTIQSIISRAKSVMMNSQALERAAGDYSEKTAAEVYYYYEELLARNNAVDFDDLLLKAVLLLENNGEIRDLYQRQYPFLMIDEFQDTNVAQYQLSRLLTGPSQNVCVVGDPDQSIYSWRNADIRNILSFQSDYPGAKVIALEQNYRSTGAILSAAKSLIASNRMRLDKDLFTSNADGDPLVVHEAYDEEEEARLRHIRGGTPGAVQELQPRGLRGDVPGQRPVAGTGGGLSPPGSQVPAGGRSPVLPSAGDQGPAGLPASPPEPPGRGQPGPGGERTAPGYRSQDYADPAGVGPRVRRYPCTPPCSRWPPPRIPGRRHRSVLRPVLSMPSRPSSRWRSG